MLACPIRYIKHHYQEYQTVDNACVGSYNLQISIFQALHLEGVMLQYIENESRGPARAFDFTDHIRGAARRR